MSTVERTQISLDAAQAARLRRLARERGTSMAALIRDAVEQVYPDSADESLRARWTRAVRAVREGGLHSDRTDTAERHDDYLAEHDRW